jgi:hypothetical protein
MCRRMNFSGDESYNRAESNDEENIKQEAPTGAQPTVVEEDGVSTERRRQDGGKLAWEFGRVGIRRGKIVHDGSLRKFEGDSLVDALKQRMAAGRYGEGPGVVAMCTVGRV